MSLIYSGLGFPCYVEDKTSPYIVQDGDEKRVFYSPTVEAIYKRRCEQTRPDFAESLAQVVELAKVWELTGGFFEAILTPGVRLTPAVQSFILETARCLMRESERRRVSIQDRALILKQPDSDEDRVPPSFTEEERLMLDVLANQQTEDLFGRWVSRLGVDDLSQSFQLYVGEAPVR